MKDEILALLAKNQRCVISTVSPDRSPEAAMVGFAEWPTFELLIGTSNKSRKYQNLRANPKVAIVIGFGSDASVQYEGLARQLDGDEIEPRVQKYLEKLPGATAYIKSDEQVWFTFTPTWLRYMVHGPNERIEEMREFV